MPSSDEGQISATTRTRSSNSFTDDHEVEQGAEPRHWSFFVYVMYGEQAEGKVQ